MKKSTSILLSSLVALGMLSTTANADIAKGGKAYLKMCKKCHGNGAKGAAMHTQAEWEALFADDGEMIIKAHEGDKSEKLFNGKKYKKYSPHIKDFLFEYGSDSGNVPSCG